MPYQQTIYDNFNDNSINGSLWSPSHSTDYISEVSGKLKVTCSETTDVYVYGTPTYDITKGIIAAKFYTTGTPDEYVKQVFGIYAGTIDYEDYTLALYADTDTADLGFSSYVASFASESIVKDTVIGLGPSWTDGTYLGAYFNANDDTFHFVKSTDGVTWTNVFMGTLDYNTIDFSSVGLYLGLSNNDYIETNYSIQIDDASYFAHVSAKAMVSSAFISATPKVRVGGSWVEPAVKARVGGSWVSL